MKMDLKLAEIGNRISKRRKHLKLKQEDLAVALDISNNHLSSIERGRSSLSLELFCSICAELKVTPDYLLLGAMHSNNVSQNIMDSLRLCTDEQISFVSDFVKLILDKRFPTLNSDK